MRTMIETPTYMTYDEMEKTYHGKWILVANCDFNPHNSILGGRPVAVADSKLEGYQDGFYDRFKAKEYAPRAFCDFDHDSPPKLFGVYRINFGDGDNNATCDQ